MNNFHFSKDGALKAILNKDNGLSAKLNVEFSYYESYYSDVDQNSGLRRRYNYKSRNI